MVNELTIPVSRVTIVNVLTESRPVVGVLVGSTREGSFTRRLVDLVAAAAGPELVVIDGLERLPYFSEELEADVPEVVVAFREAVAAVDALLIASPEYNDGMPGMLKNAIDWLSRPRPGAVLTAKPVAALGASPSPGGARGAVCDLKAVLSRAGAQVIGEGIFVPSVHEVLAEGVPHELSVRLQAQVDALVADGEAAAA